VHESNDRALKFGTTTGVNSGGREGLPHDRLANVGGNEEGNATAKTIALLEELVEENDDETSNDKLDHKQDADTSAEVRWLSVEPRDNVNNSLAK